MLTLGLDSFTGSLIHDLWSTPLKIPASWLLSGVLGKKMFNDTVERWRDKTSTIWSPRFPGIGTGDGYFRIGVVSLNCFEGSFQFAQPSFIFPPLFSLRFLSLPGPQTRFVSACVPRVETGDSPIVKTSLRVRESKKTQKKRGKSRPGRYKPETILKKI